MSSSPSHFFSTGTAPLSPLISLSLTQLPSPLSFLSPSHSSLSFTLSTLASPSLLTPTTPPLHATPTTNSSHFFSPHSTLSLHTAPLPHQPHHHKSHHFRPPRRTQPHSHALPHSISSPSSNPHHGSNHSNSSHFSFSHATPSRTTPQGSAALSASTKDDSSSPSSSPSTTHSSPHTAAPSFGYPHHAAPLLSLHHALPPSATETSSPTVARLLLGIDCVGAANSPELCGSASRCCVSFRTYLFSFFFCLFSIFAPYSMCCDIMYL